MDIIWLFVSECFNRETKGTTCSFKLRDIINIVTSNEWVDNIHIYAERQWTIKFIKLCIAALDVFQRQLQKASLVSYFHINDEQTAELLSLRKRSSQ